MALLDDESTGTERNAQEKSAGAKILRVVSPAPRDVWLDVLKSDPTAFVYQSPEGLDALCAELDREDASRLYEFADGRQLILPLYRRRGAPKWLAVERSPKVGGLVSSGPVRPEELQAIFSDLCSRPLLRTIVRPMALFGDAWAAAAPPGVNSVQRVAHALDLQGGFETVWEQRFNRQARRAIRKAEKAQLDIECDRTGKLVPVFYDLLQRSVDRWAEQRHEPRHLARWRAKHRDPQRRFRIMAETLGEACQIWVARVDGQPAAAIVVLQGANAHYTRGAMDKDLAGPVRASFLLQKLAIEDACKAGCRYYYMGETGTSESLARFKSHFGAQEYAFPEYHLERFPITSLENRLRGFARKLFDLRRNVHSSLS